MAKAFTRINFLKGSFPEIDVAVVIQKAADHLKCEAPPLSQETEFQVQDSLHRALVLFDNRHGVKDKDLRAAYVGMRNAANTLIAVLQPASRAYNQQYLIHRDLGFTLAEAIQWDVANKDGDNACTRSAFIQRLEAIVAIAEAALDQIDQQGFVFLGDKSSMESDPVLSVGRAYSDAWKLPVIQAGMVICRHLNLDPTVSVTDKQSTREVKGKLFITVRLLEKALSPGRDLSFGADRTLSDCLIRLRPHIEL